MEYFIPGLIIGAVVLVGIVFLVAIAFRTVVPTNMVHIVQSKRKTVSYGGVGQVAGNVYYRWPSWFPMIGVTYTALPISNFELPLIDYSAYDKDRVPFVLDVITFLRISDTNKAAERISNFNDLKQQLLAVVQGAVRKILASYDINEIMVGRATFGRQFTDEVRGEMEGWGVEPVKSMELMDIRDARDSQVIARIMAMKSSHIEMTSRTEVAANKQKAETAEIEAGRQIALRRQEAEQSVGERTAETKQAVGIAGQKADQQIKEQEAITKAKEIEVSKVGQVGQANIVKDTAIVRANQDKDVARVEKEAAVIRAEQSKEVATVESEGQLAATRNRATGIETEGEAKGKAELAMQMAPVNAQIALAEKIAELASYQQYLVAIKAIEAGRVIGIAQAEALAEAEVKVIAQAGTPVAGATSAMQLFTPTGGFNLAGMATALASSPEGLAILNAIKERFAPATNEGAQA